VKNCPWCAELIQDAARICKHCHQDVVSPRQPSLLENQGVYNVPLRFEQQGHSYGPGGGGVHASSQGIAVKGQVCPTCRSTDYVSQYSLWHGVLALGFFPIGLAAFFFPLKRCGGCGTKYGAGREMTRVLGILALCLLIFVCLIIIILAAAG
jgi:RNA polymerase subunit RPABC4/transcription elongation factor Spt4